MSRMAIPTVTGLGRLIDLTVRQRDEQRQRLIPTTPCWLAWCDRTRALIVLRGGRGWPLHCDDSMAARRHHVFHGAVPGSVRLMEQPTARGRLQTIGLIEAVTYCADAIDSPSKRAFHWHHAFGDRGQHGHGTMRDNVAIYPDRYLPALTIDAAGSWFITRRPGNRYEVRDWIIG
jgi:hypothetical protein